MWPNFGGLAGGPCDSHKEGGSCGRMAGRYPALAGLSALRQEEPARFKRHKLPRLEKEMATHPVFLPGESHEQKSLAGHGP